MWEKDKQLLKMYRECMQNLMSDLKSGEEIEWEDACAVESAKLQQYTSDMIILYKNKNIQNVSEKKASFYTPRIPYHQNFWLSLAFWGSF